MGDKDFTSKNQVASKTSWFSGGQADPGRSPFLVAYIMTLRPGQTAGREKFLIDFYPLL